MITRRSVITIVTTETIVTKVVINVCRLLCTVCLIFDSNQTLISFTDFTKILPYNISQKSMLQELSSVWTQAGMIKLVVASHNFANVPKMSSHFENTYKEINSHDRLEARKLFFIPLQPCGQQFWIFGAEGTDAQIMDHGYLKSTIGEEMLYGAITRLHCLWRITCPTLPQLFLRRAHSHWDSNAKY